MATKTEGRARSVKGCRNMLDDTFLFGNCGKPFSMDTQEGHIKQFNELGVVMAGMPDYYKAGKKGSRVLLSSLQSNYAGPVVLAGDRYDYEPDSLYAIITYYFGSEVVVPKKAAVLLPHYHGATLDEVLSTKKGLHCIQKIFETQDNAETIKETLERLMRERSRNIIVSTPYQEDRRAYPSRVACFSWDIFKQFSVNCGGYLDTTTACSYGVRSPKGAMPNLNRTKIVTPEQVLALSKKYVPTESRKEYEMELRELWE